MMKIRADLHTHTTFSCDAEDTIEAMCQRAADIGLKAICFTEHVDYNPYDRGFNFFRVEEYLKEIDRMRSIYAKDILVLSGIEFSEPHLYQEELRNFDQYDLDLILGSAHMLGKDFVGDAILENMYSREETEALYYKLLEESALYGNFDVLAHFDYPKRYYKEASDISKYSDRILRAIVKNDIALEINTGAYRKGLAESIPSIDIVNDYIKLGGNKLTMGSDSHNIHDVAADFENAESQFDNDTLKKFGVYVNRAFKSLSEL